MKIFATSDMHGNLNGLDPSGSDIVIIAGDLAKQTGFGKWHHYDMKKWIQKTFCNWTAQYPNIEFVFIPGNHDFALDPSKTEIYSDLNWKYEFPSNVHFLSDTEINIKGLRIYGTPWVPIISYRWAFEAEHDKLIEKFNMIPENVDVLITHAPPRIPNCNIDISIQTNNGPFGSSELTHAIFVKQPRYVFCGHIHTGYHKPIKFENSTIYNVSRLDEDYEIAYEPTVLDIM